MSFFGKIWGGVKKVGGFIGKIVTSKKTKDVVNVAAGVVNGVGSQATSPPPDIGDKPASSSWLDFLSGTSPIDLNKYVTLPTVSTTVKPVNWLMVAAIAFGGILLFRKNHRSYG